MKLLYDEKKTIVETFDYGINQGGELNVRIGPPGTPSSRVSITFINKQFSEAKFDFRGTYTRSHWHVLGAVAERIKEIEAAMYAPLDRCL